MEGGHFCSQPIFKKLEFNAPFIGFPAFRLEQTAGNASRPRSLWRERFRIVGKKRDGFPWLIGHPNRWTECEIGLAIFSLIRIQVLGTIDQCLLKVVKPS